MCMGFIYLKVSNTRIGLESSCRVTRSRLDVDTHVYTCNACKAPFHFAGVEYTARLMSCVLSSTVCIQSGRPMPGYHSNYQRPTRGHAHLQSLAAVASPGQAARKTRHGNGWHGG